MVNFLGSTAVWESLGLVGSPPLPCPQHLMPLCGNVLMKTPCWRGRREGRPASGPLVTDTGYWTLRMCQALGAASCGTTRAILATPVLMSILTFSTGEAETRKAKLGGGEEVDSLGSGLPSGATPGEQKSNIHLCSLLCLQQVAAYWEGAGPGLQGSHRGRHHWLMDLHHAQKIPFLSCRCHGQKTRV